MKECRPNVYCCGGNCDCDKDAVFFVDPKTGQVKEASKDESLELPIWWAVDSTLLASSSTMAGASTKATSTSTPTSTPTPTPKPKPTFTPTESQGASASETDASLGGLSTKKVIAISVGVSTCLALITAIVWFALSRRSKRRAREREMRSREPSPQPPANPTSSHGRRHTYISSDNVYEMDGGAAMCETKHVYEMDGGTTYETRIHELI